MVPPTHRVIQSNDRMYSHADECIKLHITQLTGCNQICVISNGVFFMSLNGDYNPKSDNPNVAESEGAVHRGSLEEQWKCIIQASPKQADFSFGWKSLRFG